MFRVIEIGDWDDEADWHDVGTVLEALVKIEELIKQGAGADKIKLYQKLDFSVDVKVSLDNPPTD